MNESVVRKTNVFGAWCGIAYVAMLFIGWFCFAGFFPPKGPSAGADEIYGFLSHDVGSIRFGMIIVMWGAAVFIPFVSTIADFVARFEGRNGPLTRTMTMAGYANAMLTFYPPLWWIVSTWRIDERTAGTAQLLNDIAWLQFIGGLSLIMPMFAVLAVVVFNDKSETPIFPRWFGYQSVMTFVLFLPDQLLFFFKTGPFAWNGVLAFWVPLTVFCGWFISIFVLMRRTLAAEKEPAGAAQSAQPVG